MGFDLFYWLHKLKDLVAFHSKNVIAKLMSLFCHLNDNECVWIDWLSQVWQSILSTVTAAVKHCTFHYLDFTLEGSVAFQLISLFLNLSFTRVGKYVSGVFWMPMWRSRHCRPSSPRNTPNYLSSGGNGPLWSSS